MSRVQNKQARIDHARNYIQAVFADRLREEGFSCPDDKLLCWYRLVNKEIVNSICFFSRWSSIPIMMDIGYGIHPMFLKPVTSSDPYFSGRPGDERFFEISIEEAGPLHHYAPYSKEVLVYAPQYYGRGIYTFDNVLLPRMNNILTLDDCYRFHREIISYRLSPLMIDEAIVLNDTSVYPECIRTLEKLIDLNTEQYAKFPSKKELAKRLQALHNQYTVLVNGGREEYLSLLEKKKRKTLVFLSKISK